MRPLAAHWYLGLGKLHRRTGNQAKAEAHLQTATTMYREMEMHFWLGDLAELRQEVVRARMDCLSREPGGSSQGAAVRLFRERGSRLGEVQAFTAVTIFHHGLARVGFEI
jgi:Tetratricopeptide repeat